MGVFDRADEGSDEAQAYRAELAAENARLAAKAAPAILTVVGIVFLWIAVTAAASYARDARLPDVPVCEGHVMERGDTCWAILSRGRGDRGEPMFELLARTGNVVEVPAVVMKGGLTEKPYPYDYDRRLSFQRQTRANLTSAVIPGSIGIVTLALAITAVAMNTGRRPRAGAEVSATALRQAIVDGAQPLSRARSDALRAHGTPLLTADPGDPARVRALFVWRQDSADSPLGVYLWANRLTDKHRVDAGLMELRPAGDYWFVELTVPRDVLVGYRILPFRADTPGIRDGRPVDGRAIRSAAQPDPLNRTAGSSFGSVLRGPSSPDLSPWLGLEDDAPSPVLDDTTGGDPAVRYRLFVPPGEGEVELVIVFDADAWIDGHRLPAVVERLRSRGNGPRVCVLGIDSPTSPKERLRFLGSDAVRGTIADEVLPAAMALLPRAPRRVLAAGQSMGAIAALALARACPGRIDTVLAYSPSVWWRPGLTARPESVRPREQWVHDLLSTPGAPIALHLAVGSYEDELAPNVAAVASTARAHGHTVTETVFTGGHDETDWAALLLDDLRLTDHPMQQVSSDEDATAASGVGMYLWRGFLLACAAGFLVLASRSHGAADAAAGPVRCDGLLMERQDTCLLIDQPEIGAREDLVRAGDPSRELRAYTARWDAVVGRPMTHEQMAIERAADRRQSVTEAYGFGAVALLLACGICFSFSAITRPVGCGTRNLVRRLRRGRRTSDRTRLTRALWGSGTSTE